jgi:hypothetical protein
MNHPQIAWLQHLHKMRRISSWSPNTSPPSLSSPSRSNNNNISLRTRRLSYAMFIAVVLSLCFAIAGKPSLVYGMMLVIMGLASAQRASIAELQPQPLRMERDFTGNDYDMLLELDRNVPDQGLHRAQIERLPEFVYEESKEAQCAICLENFMQGERLRAVPCLHRFHAKCIDHWLISKPVCPVCKFPVSLDDEMI